LMAHLRDISGVTEESLLLAAEVEEEPRLASEIFERPIETLDLTVRVFNSLKRTGITTVGEVLEMLEKGPDAMLSIRNFGEKSLDELKLRLQEKGYLDEDEPEEQVEKAE
jgi:DNA-directed RNA polymerase subunit alpha